MKTLGNIPVFAVFAFISLFLINTCHSAEFLRRQAGTTTFTGNSSTVAIPITLADLSKSILLFSSTLSNNDPNNYQIGGEITDASTMTFIRSGNTGTVSISWEIIEFESGVNVQRGSNVVPLSTNVDITINCVDLDKSFAIVYGRNDGTTLGNDDGVTANLTSSTNLRLLTGTTGGDHDEAYWQVIEYEGAQVQKLAGTLTGTSLTSTIPTAVDINKTIVLSNHLISANFVAGDLPRTELTSSNQVTYTRNSSTGNCTFLTYVVEFTDLTAVSRGTQNFGTGVTSQTVSGLTTTASSCVIAPGNYLRQGSTSQTGNDNTGYNWFTYRIASATTLQIDRAIGTGATASAPWQIVSFENTDNGLQTNTFYSIGSGDWETSANWSYTPDGSSGAVPDGVHPTRTNNVVIQNAHAITIDDVTDNYPCSESPTGLGLANVGAFVGSTDPMFYHTGDLIVSNGGSLTSSEEVMVAGYTLIENGANFTINEDIINLGFLEISSTATFDNTDDLILSGNSYTIMNNVSSTFDDLYIDHTDALLCGSGALEIGNSPGPASPSVQYLNGASAAQICNDLTITCNNDDGDCVPFTGPSGSFSIGNSGPGGVGKSTDNTLWLRADSGPSTTTNGDPINTWTDRSGNSNNATQGTAAKQPLYQSSAINGMPTVLFDNSTGAALADEMLVSDNDNLDNTAGLTLFTVIRPLNLNGSPKGIISKRTNYGVDQSYSMFFHTGNALFIDLDANNNRFGTPSTFTNGNNYIATLHFDGTLTAAQRTKVYIGESLDITATETSATIPNYASNMTIGSLNSNDGRPFGGHIAEIALYRRSLTSGERIIVNNYLSAKYDIPLTANDVYTMDNSANGEYDFEVAGIGQASDGSNHRDAQGTGIVRMWNPNDLDNGEFLIWGHDNSILNSTTTSGVDGSVIEERLARIWALSESGGDVGNVSISFDFSSLGGSPLGSNLRLLIDRDDDGFDDNDVTPIVGSVSGNIAVFSNINFVDGDRFTLGNTDVSIPLPIELFEFNVFQEESQVVAQWTTLTELNNDFFTLQRSDDGINWSNIGTLPGAGTTNQQKKYQTIDEDPLRGISYYRLKQTDFDGMFSFSPVKLVSFNDDAEILIYPNPSSGFFNISGVKSDHPDILIYNLLGQKTPYTLANDQVMQVDLCDQPPGIYIIKVTDGNYVKSFTVINKQ